MDGLATVKLVLGLDHDEQDNYIKVLLKLTKQQLQSLLRAETVPEELSYIVIDVTVARYNRRRHEGMASHEQEGERSSYPSSDFAAYQDVLFPYIQAGRRGRIVINDALR